MKDPRFSQDRLVHDVIYESGPLTSHFDVHAGGVLFGFVYQEFLRFSNSGVVQRWRSVLDSFWQMEHEVKDFSTEQLSSKYRFNERGYIEFSFPESQYYGSVLPTHGEALAFYISGLKGQRSHSLAYRLGAGAKPKPKWRLW